MYKELSRKVRPLKLKVESKIFISEWSACIKNKDSDLTELIKMITPAIQHWENLFNGTVSRMDINFITLCRLLDPKDPLKALAVIKKWLQWIESNSTIESELLYIFIERTRKFRYAPTLATDRMAEYIVARDFKLGIYHHIRYISRLMKRDACYYKDSAYTYEVAYNPKYTDYLLLKHIDIEFTAWQSYLFHLLREGYSSVQRSELTKIHRRNLYTEEKKIWHSINKLL